MASGLICFARRAAHAALLVFVAWLAPAPAALASEPDGTLVIETQSGNVTIRIETARTAGEHAKGLMFRRSLADDAGMLFEYDGARDIHMWMRNTYIPLDMLFIGSNGIIKRIARETEPFSEETISSGSPVTAVLEIGGGRAAAFGIRSGDRVIHPHFKP